MTKRNLWIIPVTVHWRKTVSGVNALIDTGANFSLIAEALADRAGLWGIGIYGDVVRGKGTVLRDFEFREGYVRFDPFPECVATVRFAPVPDELLPDGVDVIVGMDFLRQVEAKLDLVTLSMACSGTVPPEFFPNPLLRVKPRRGIARL